MDCTERERNVKICFGRNCYREDHPKGRLNLRSKLCLALPLPVYLPTDSIPKRVTSFQIKSMGSFSVYPNIQERTSRVYWWEQVAKHDCRLLVYRNDTTTGNSFKSKCMVVYEMMNGMERFCKECMKEKERSEKNE